jgi:hypothetical protein
MKRLQGKFRQFTPQNHQDEDDLKNDAVKNDANRKQEDDKELER